MSLKRCIKLTPNRVIRRYQETLDLEEDGIKADLKVEFHLFHMKHWISCNTNATRCIFFYKEAIIPHCPSLSFFPSVLEKVSLLSKPDDLHQSSESHSLPPLLRLCCINNFLFSFALSIIASLGSSSAYKHAHILLLLKKTSPGHSTANCFPHLTSPPGESQLLCPLPNLCKTFLGRQAALLCLDAALCS